MDYDNLIKDTIFILDLQVYHDNKSATIHTIQFEVKFYCFFTLRSYIYIYGKV